MAKSIVAFGDSNTRYYLGDPGIAGPLRDAWPAKLEMMLRREGVDAQVRNEGRPGEQMDYAVAEFAQLTAGADLCILGFGTNDVKKPEVTLEGYLAQLGAVLDQAKEGGIPLVVLGIPWFSEELAGAEMQARIPGWNGAAEQLCQEAGRPFVPLYDAFLDDPERWFNEQETPKRHLSGVGQRRVAELALPAVLEALK